MKDVAKVAIGVFLGLTICAILTLAVMVWLTPSEYEKCLKRCEAFYKGHWLELASSTEEYVRVMRQVRGEVCPDACRKSPAAYPY